MALVNPPDLRRLTEFLDGLPRCPQGCHREAVYLTPTFRAVTADDTMDAQVDELILRYEREAPLQMQQHIAADHQGASQPRAAELWLRLASSLQALELAGENPYLDHDHVSGKSGTARWDGRRWTANP